MKLDSHIPEQEAPMLLNAQQVADLLGVSVRHLYKLHNSGRLPAPIRLGRAVRWRREELQAWITAGTPNRARWQAIQAVDKK